MCLIKEIGLHKFCYNLIIINLCYSKYLNESYHSLDKGDKKEVENHEK